MFTVYVDIFSLLPIIAVDEDVLLTIFTFAPSGDEVISCLRGEAVPIYMFPTCACLNRLMYIADTVLMS